MNRIKEVLKDFGLVKREEVTVLICEKCLGNFGSRIPRFPSHKMIRTWDKDFEKLCENSGQLVRVDGKNPNTTKRTFLY